MRDAQAKIPEEVRKEITDKVEALKKAKDGDDAESVKRASQDLAIASQKIGEILYKQEQDKNKDAGSGQSGNVKDAEFEDKKDEDKN